MSLPVAGIELGGTKCVAILAHGPDAIIEQVTIPTQEPSKTLPAIEAVLDRWSHDVGFSALGLGAFGPIDLDPQLPTYGTILATPKPGWAGVSLVSRFADRYSVPIGIQTDVNGAALAEGRWGAARGLDNFVYVTVGTGVGAGLVIGGKLVGGQLPVEVGHMRAGRVADDTWVGSCSFHGDCIEGLAAGPAIEARTGQRASSLGPDDPVWPFVAYALGGLLHNLALTTAPQVILLGGGVMARQPHLLDKIRKALVESLALYVPLNNEAVESLVTTPMLGAAAGPLGAIAIALDALA
jgi:fructokinase